MKRALIIMSITIVGMLAFVDAKTRMEELDEISAATPTQVEMKREIPKSWGEGIQQKPDVSKNLARPQDKNNDFVIQNIPQKLNPRFEHFYQQTPPTPVTPEVPAPIETQRRPFSP